MGHALFGYDGPCRNIHGHTYHLEVTVLGAPIDDTNDVKLGMVMDFSDLKMIVYEHIISKFDHVLVLNQDAPYAKSDVLISQFERVVLVPYQPTCENLMLDFLHRIRPLFHGGTKLVRLCLRETPSSYSEWRIEDNL